MWHQLMRHRLMRHRLTRCKARCGIVKHGLASVHPEAHTERLSQRPAPLKLQRVDHLINRRRVLAKRKTGVERLGSLTAGRADRRRLNRSVVFVAAGRKPNGAAPATNRGAARQGSQAARAQTSRLVIDDQSAADAGARQHHPERPGQRPAKPGAQPLASVGSARGHEWLADFMGTRLRSDWDSASLALRVAEWSAKHRQVSSDLRSSKGRVRSGARLVLWAGPCRSPGIVRA